MSRRSSSCEITGRGWFSAPGCTKEEEWNVLDEDKAESRGGKEMFFYGNVNAYCSDVQCTSRVRTYSDECNSCVCINRTELKCMRCVYVFYVPVPVCVCECVLLYVNVNVGARV